MNIESLNRVFDFDISFESMGGESVRLPSNSSVSNLSRWDDFGRASALPPESHLWDKPREWVTNVFSTPRADSWTIGDNSDGMRKEVTFGDFARSIKLAFFGPSAVPEYASTVTSNPVTGWSFPAFNTSSVIPDFTKLKTQLSTFHPSRVNFISWVASAAPLKPGREGPWPH